MSDFKTPCKALYVSIIIPLILHIFPGRGIHQSVLVIDQLCDGEREGIAWQLMYAHSLYTYLN